MIWRTAASVSGSKARATVTSPSSTSAVSTLVARLLFIELLAQFQVLDVVEKFDHFFVRAVTEGAEESGGEEFPAAFAPIEINVKQIAGVELHFDPRTAIRNDAEAVEHLAVEMNARFKGDARRAMQLADDDALRAVDHECALTAS